jgi:hypothetical protein
MYQFVNTFLTINIQCIDAVSRCVYIYQLYLLCVYNVHVKSLLCSHLYIKFIDTVPKLILLVGSLKMNTALEYSTRVVQEGDRRCKKSTLNDLVYLTPLRIPLMNPVCVWTPIVPYRIPYLEILIKC